MDFDLTEEQQLIRETARAFCDREIVPHAREWDRTERMDLGIVAKLAEIGFLGCALPVEHGGMGLDTVSYCVVMEELGRADSSVRGIVSVNNGLAGKTIAKWGTEEQKAEWIPKLCTGEALGCAEGAAWATPACVAEGKLGGPPWVCPSGRRDESAG